MEESKQVRGTCDGLVYIVWIGASLQTNVGEPRDQLSDNILFLFISYAWLKPRIPQTNLHFGRTGVPRALGNVIEATSRLPCPDLQESCLTNLQLAASVITKRQLSRTASSWQHFGVLGKAYIGPPKGLQSHLPDLKEIHLSAMYRGLRQRGRPLEDLSDRRQSTISSRPASRI